MNISKIRSIKQASFFSIMKGSLMFAIINFLIFFVFLITLAYLFISNQEDNLSKILINDLKGKQQRSVYISESLANKKLKDLGYYIVDFNGDIIFHSYEDSLITKEDNIKNSFIMTKGIGKTNGMIYKDKLLNKLVIGTIRKESDSSMYIIVQYNLFGNTVILNGLLIMLGVAGFIIFLFILIISSQVSSVITNYINIFRNQVKKISEGDYDIKLSTKYPHEEINDIIENFNNMAQKIKSREEELQIYNEEINTMLSTINKTEKEREEQYLQIIWTMVSLLEIKDEYTAGHSKSVTYYAEQISEKLNKDYGFKLDIERIQIAAMLHDIGKIGIEKSLLTKPERLTAEEYEIIKTHPSKGYYALKNIETLKEERKIIKYHHERYDGSGYPEGLKGDDIPLSARIICIADAFDAMVSNRTYRVGMPISVAIEELIKNKGTQFDPFIVDVFVSMLMEEQSKAE